MTQGKPGTLDVFLVRVAHVRCALPLDTVVEVLPLVATSPLPRSPALVAGVIDVRGTVVPVLSLRERLALPPRAPDPDDHVVLCDLGTRVVGVWVDRAEDLAVVDPEDVTAASDVATAEFLAGVARLPDGLILVYDVPSFLAADEALKLDEAMAAASAGRR